MSKLKITLCHLAGNKFDEFKDLFKSMLYNSFRKRVFIWSLLVTKLYHLNY